jgi:hypothetical protein
LGELQRYRLAGAVGRQTVVVVVVVVVVGGRP